LKHVWILNHYAQEPGGPGGTRHYALAKRLPANGWTASILAASTEHKTGRQRVARGESARLESHDGVPFLWLKAGDYRSNGADRVRNILDYTRAVLRPGNLAGLQPPDAIVGSSVHPLAAWAGRRLAKRFSVPFIFEVRDLWPQTLIDMGLVSSKHPLAVGLRWLERSLYKSAGRIIVLLPRAGDYIEPLGIPRDRIVWIPNGVDFDDFRLTEAADEGDGFTLMYFGAHGAANGLDNVIRAMRIIEDAPDGKGIKLRLIGDGPLKPALISLAREVGAGNVSFEDAIPKRMIPQAAASADAFVFNLLDVPVFRYGISSNKLFEFMAARRPVVFCCRSGNNPVAEAGCGPTVPPGDPQALARAILDLAALPAGARRAMGDAGRAHVEANYGFDSLARRFAQALDASVAVQ
jgi:glycosyltransferase involved in cell wall biosynthesis